MPEYKDNRGKDKETKGGGVGEHKEDGLCVGEKMFVSEKAIVSILIKALRRREKDRESLRGADKHSRYRLSVLLG